MFVQSLLICTRFLNKFSSIMTELPNFFLHTAHPKEGQHNVNAEMASEQPHQHPCFSTWWDLSPLKDLSLDFIWDATIVSWQGTLCAAENKNVNAVPEEFTSAEWNRHKQWETINAGHNKVLGNYSTEGRWFSMEGITELAKFTLGHNFGESDSRLGILKSRMGR